LAEFYNDLSPLAAAELATLSDADEPALSRLAFESVTAERTADHGEHIAVLFRDPERPGCLFGWRWSWTEDPQAEDLEFAASMLRVNFEEDVLSERYGLPEDCASAGVTWF
jgi:hypothetical protein